MILMGGRCHQWSRNSSSSLILMAFVLLNCYFVCLVFCRSLFVFLSFFFWPLYCLSFDLRFLITLTVSSTNLSYDVLSMLVNLLYLLILINIFVIQYRMIKQLIITGVFFLSVNCGCNLLQRFCIFKLNELKQTKYDKY